MTLEQLKDAIQLSWQSRDCPDVYHALGWYYWMRGEFMPRHFRPVRRMEEWEWLHPDAE